MKYYLTALQKYLVLEGRSSRLEYWYFMMIHFIISAGLWSLSNMVAATSETLSLVLIAIYFLYSLLVLVPTITITVRRLHDLGRSGWNLLLFFIPLFGSLILLVWLATEGEWEDNFYGKHQRPQLIQLAKY